MFSFSSNILLVLCSVSLLVHTHIANGERDLRSAQDLKWPGGIVSYKLSSELSEEEQLVILNAMKSISSQTCIIFTPLTNEVDFLSINALRGLSPCRSVFGRTTGEQVMQLGVTPYKNCIEHGTILHYLMKVLGFPSEHRRPDRDEYVEIYWANIISGKRFTFQKLEKEIFIYNLENEPYDYSSLMHPDPYKFARDPEIPVIFPKNVDETEIEIGQRVGLSDGDIRKIRDAYNCPNDKNRLSNSGEMIRRMSNSNWFWKVLHLIWFVGSKVFPDRFVIAYYI